jgi:hypothetical protein
MYNAGALMVTPLILQFFVVQVLWIHLAGADPSASRGRIDPTLLPTPLLMLGTGALFFSSPLREVWKPWLGPGGEAFAGFPPGGALGFAAGLNVAVLLVALTATGGLRTSPLVPLAVALPFVAGLLATDTARGALLLAGAASSVIVTILARKPASGTRTWAGLASVLLLLGVAAWLEPLAPGATP